VFVLDGADGRAIKLSAKLDHYVVENTVRVLCARRRCCSWRCQTGLSAAQCALGERLAECGWLARRVAAFAESPPAAGLVCQVR
jgi:hypothetical protein